MDWMLRVEVVKLLIEEKMTVDAKDKDGWTPLYPAAQNGHLEVVKLLIEEKAAVDAKNNEDWTPLHSAARNGHLEVVKLLIEEKATVDAKNKDGQTPLHSSALKGHFAVVDLLIHRSAGSLCDSPSIHKSSHRVIDCDTRDVFGLTPLLSSIYGGHQQ